MSEAQKPAGKSCAGSLIAEIKHNQSLDSKTSDIATHQCQTPPSSLQFIVKPPLLESALSSLTKVQA